MEKNPWVLIICVRIPAKPGLVVLDGWRVEYSCSRTLARSIGCTQHDANIPEVPPTANGSMVAVTDMLSCWIGLAVRSAV